MTFSHYCTCGASLVGTAKPAHMAQGIVDGWKQIHSGEGHAPCDQATAARMRQKSDRQERKAAAHHG